MLKARVWAATKLIRSSSVLVPRYCARGYSEEEIVALIKQPVPENWQITTNGPITWVADEDLATIATWITSLEVDEQE